MKKRKLPGLPKLSKPGQPPKQGGAAAKGRKLPKLPFPPWLLASCAAMLALGWLAQNLWLPQGWELGTPSAAHTTTEVLPVSGVVISEVMSSNKAAWAGPQGLYPDWVELTNQGDQAVDISGWTLTDSPDSKVRFSFDSQVLQPGQCLLVYMTGNLQTAPDAPYEAPCKLSASGDALLLYDASGSIMQAMNLPALAGDTAYALEGASGGLHRHHPVYPGAGQHPLQSRRPHRPDRRQPGGDQRGDGGEPEHAPGRGRGFLRLGGAVQCREPGGGPHRLRPVRRSRRPAQMALPPDHIGAGAIFDRVLCRARRAGRANFTPGSSWRRKGKACASATPQAA